MKTCSIKGMPMLTDLKGIRGRCGHVSAARGVIGKTFIATRPEEQNAKLLAGVFLSKFLNSGRSYETATP